MGRAQGGCGRGARRSPPPPCDQQAPLLHCAAQFILSLQMTHPTDLQTRVLGDMHSGRSLCLPSSALSPCVGCIRPPGAALAASK